LLGRIGERSFHANFKIVRAPYWEAWRLAPWVALAVIAYWRGGDKARGNAAPPWGPIIVMIVASAMIAVTLLVSPKQGGRLDFASTCLACSAVASATLPFVRTRGARIAAWLIAGAAVAYLLYNCLATYATVGPEFARRFDAIESAAPQAVVTVTPYSLPRSRWFLGEDFGAGADSLRFGIAWNRKLQGVLLDQPAEENLDPGGP
jgi:hypothetical protein